MSERASKVAFLAVGTEITDGQIADRNSQWLSSRLVALGFEADQIRAVPDDRRKIVAALREFSERVGWVFVTGGLGPTSDDFTRDCVAEVLEAPLDWHEPSWLEILERLKARGATATENQKQQCFFPKASQILRNSRGTAHAFFAVAKNGTRIVSLPGPPLEIEVIWNDGLKAEIQKYVAEMTAAGVFKKARQLTLIRTMGLGEGALADRVESLLDRIAEARISRGLSPVDRPELGYRAHAPYVEIKIWADETQVEFVTEAAKEIRYEFKEYYVNEGLQDAADRFLEKVLANDKQGIETHIEDSVSRGAVLQRLFERAHDLGRTDLIAALDRSVHLAVSPKHSQLRDCYALSVGADDLTLQLEMPDEDSTVKLPRLALSLRSDRGRKWAVEFALLEWGRS